MGTRAITNVYDGGTHLFTIYRQSDGYLSGHGADIVEALGARKLVNGIQGDFRGVTNGMGCAAALLIAHLKRDMKAGNIYIHAPNPDASEEYTYTLRGDTFAPEAGIRLTVTSYGKTLFDGPLTEFSPEAVEAVEGDA